MTRSVSFDGCFGLLHDAGGDTGVVILSPFGVESLASWKSLRLLAEECARRGFPTLRFDYPGTGNSLGDEAERDAIASRRAGALRAIAHLKAVTGVERVVLIGLRLGASIVASIGAEAGVERVALMAPVVSGRRYLRELQSMLQVAKPSHAALSSANGSDEAFAEFDGFRLSAASVASLNAMDLSKLPPPARDILVAAPQGQTAVARLCEHWRDGAHVVVAPFEGLASIIGDPTLAEPPLADLARVAEWLGESQTTAVARPASSDGVSVQTSDFIETAAWFGPEESRFGILCRSLRETAAPVVILLNTGANPHIGWARQTVEIARQLAAEGMSSLRIDVNGVGETADLHGRPKRVVYVPDTTADVSAAVDWLETQGMKSPILAGICSGAYLAFQTAMVEPRLSAVAMINLQKFFWDENQSFVIYSSTGHYLSMLRQPALWARLARGDVDAQGILRTLGERVSRALSFRLRRLARRSNDDSEHGRIRRAFADFGARGLPVLLAYSTGDGGIDEATMHLGREGAHVAWPQFRFASIDAQDHNFTSPADRATLAPLLGAFAREAIKGEPGLGIAAE